MVTQRAFIRVAFPGGSEQALPRFGSIRVDQHARLLSFLDELSSMLRHTGMGSCAVVTPSAEAFNANSV